MKWIITPQYDQIEFYSDGIYLYHQGTQVGLMNTVGDKIPGSECDSITPYLNNGFSLLLDNIGDQEATLVGIYNCKSNKVIPAKDGLYKVRTDYAFYSDNRLPVKDANSGNWGYMGIDGNIAIPCQFYRAYPFCKKCAPVRIDDKISKYINKNGVIAFTVSFADGNVKYATPFFSDTTAYVFYNGGREIAKINRKGEKISDSDGRDWNKLLTDWLFDYKKNHDNEPQEPGQRPLDIDLVEKYQSEVFAPNGQAIIRAKDGKMGILQRLDGDFSLGEPSVSKGKNKKQQHVTMQLNIPDDLSCNDLIFEIDKGDGELCMAEAKDYQISADSKVVTFEFIPNAKANSKNVKLGLAVKDHGLTVFKKSDMQVQINDPDPIPDICRFCGKRHSGKHKQCRKCGLYTDEVFPNYKCEANGSHTQCDYPKCKKWHFKKFGPGYKKNQCPGNHPRPK